VTAALRCLRVRVTGRVQGVFFRESTRREATRLGVTGWVRNCPDGSVEALICGDDARLAIMRAWLAHGPPTARVDGIEILEDALPPVLPDAFTIAG